MLVKKNVNNFSGFDGNGVQGLTGFVISLVCLLTVFARPLFFSVNGLVGFEYAGKEESPVFVFYIAIIFLATVLVYAYSFVKNSSVAGEEIIFYFFFCVLIGNHLLWVFFDGMKTPLFPSTLIFFVSMGITGFMAARVVSVFDVWQQMIRLSEVLLIVISLGLIMTTFKSFHFGQRILGVGGATYQDASYFAAVSFGMLGLATFRLERKLRYKWLSGFYGSIINIVLMLLLVLVVVLNGGRGAFVLLVVYSGLVSYWMLSKYKMSIKGVFRFVLNLFLLGILLAFIFKLVRDVRYLEVGFMRAVAYLDGVNKGLIDWEGSSNRDQVYISALNAIAESPFMGYGTFAHWEKVVQPHNIILDLFLQFGVPFALIIITFFAIKFIQSIKNNFFALPWLLMLFLWPGVNLMFSSGYVVHSAFWFTVTGLFLKSYSNNYIASQQSK